VTSHTPLGAGREFDRIRAVWARLGAGAAPSGDDCAFVPWSGRLLAISTDLSVEGTHFRAGWLAPMELGWRVAAAALSDLAAVAASPLGVMASVGVPEVAPDGLLPDLMHGVAAAAAEAGAVVMGGDLVRADLLVVDMTVIGSLERPVRRAGAAVGDGLWVTGALGAPAAAIRAWDAGNEPRGAARERFARPVARVGPGRWLRDAGATAMIDLSDGLLSDAGHLAAASGVSCRLEAERVPVHDGADTPVDALVGGEEYELLAALPERFSEREAAAFAERFALPLTLVGRVEAGSGVVLVRDGAPVAPPPGFRHFEGP